MADYLTDDEQVEALKRWVKEYGFAIVAGIVLAFAIGFGWQYWKKHKIQVANQASELFNAMLLAKTNNDTKEFDLNAKQLITNYPKSPYSSLASMTLASEYIQKANYKKAQAQYEWILNNSKDKALTAITKTRLARLYVYEKQPQKSINLLSSVNKTVFKPISEEIIGDAYLLLKHPEKARKAYKNALMQSSNQPFDRPILAMKYNNLAFKNSNPKKSKEVAV